MIDFGNLMETAIERIKPCLPENYEIDDTNCDEGIFQICVFDIEKFPGRLADRFRFMRYAGETDAEVLKRSGRTVDKYIESWR